jgi:hypothetical protein
MTTKKVKKVENKINKEESAIKNYVNKADFRPISSEPYAAPKLTSYRSPTPYARAGYIKIAKSNTKSISSSN